MKQSLILALTALLAATTSPALAQKPIGAEPPVRLKPAKTEAAGRLGLEGSLVAPVAGDKTESPLFSPVEKLTAPAVGKDAKKSKGPTEITGLKAMIDNKDHLAVFTGSVQVRDPEFNVDCDKLTVHLRQPKPADAKPAVAAPKKEEKDSESGIESAEAVGNVSIVQDKPDKEGKLQHYIGKGAKAVFDNGKQTCTLTGWPSVTEILDGNMSKEVISKEEGTVIVLNQDGRMEVTGPYRIRLLNVKAGEDKPKLP